MKERHKEEGQQSEQGIGVLKGLGVEGRDEYELWPL